MNGLKPVCELPRKKYQRSGATTERMLCDFIESGASVAEVTRDVDGKLLKQNRISALRTQIYKVAKRSGIEIRTFVRWDEQSRKYRLYLGKKGE